MRKISGIGFPSTEESLSLERGFSFLTGRQTGLLE
jgi:hypothetical protein